MTGQGNYYDVFTEQMESLRKKFDELEKGIIFLLYEVKDLVKTLNDGLNTAEVAKNIQAEKHINGDYRHALNDEMGLTRAINTFQDKVKDIIKEADNDLEYGKAVPTLLQQLGVYNFQFAAMPLTFFRGMQEVSKKILEILRGEIVLVAKEKSQLTSFGAGAQEKYGLIAAEAHSLPPGAFAINLRHLYSGEANNIRVMEKEVELVRVAFIKMKDFVDNGKSLIEQMKGYLAGALGNDLRKIPLK